MKRIIAVILINILLFTTIEPSYLFAVSRVKLNKSSLVLVKGNSINLTLISANKKIKWTTNKPLVASVKCGKIYAKKKGKAIVTAKYGNRKFYCRIKVESPKISKKHLYLITGESRRLKIKGTKKNIHWSSNDKLVVTVKKGIVKAKSKGKATVTARIQGKKFCCNVYVKEKDSVMNETDKNEQYGEKTSQLMLYVKQIIGTTLRLSDNQESEVSYEIHSFDMIPISKNGQKCKADNITVGTKVEVQFVNIMTIYPAIINGCTNIRIVE